MEKAALSASVIKPTGYKYSLSLSVIGNSTSISNRPLSLTWNDISRYIPGNEEFLSRNLSFNPLTGWLSLSK